VVFQRLGTISRPKKITPNVDPMALMFPDFARHAVNREVTDFFKHECAWQYLYFGVVA
jgi:hypothetical protein